MHADDRVAPAFFAIPQAIWILLRAPSMSRDPQSRDVPAVNQFCILRRWIALRRLRPGNVRRLIVIFRKTIRLLPHDKWSCIARMISSKEDDTRHWNWPYWAPQVIWMRHRCPWCTSTDFKPAEVRSFDGLLSMFLLRPVRCAFCWRRYYWFARRAFDGV